MEVPLTQYYFSYEYFEKTISYAIVNDCQYLQYNIGVYSRHCSFREAQVNRVLRQNGL